MQHVHIVSLSPRSGTTLLAELLVSCFEFDGHADHEMNLVYAPRPPVERFCSKFPSDITRCSKPLETRKDLWVICVLRDPRDIVVSRHRNDPDAYWADLELVRRGYAAFQDLRAHPRFLSVAYEDLVADPDHVQARLMQEIPFLVRRFDFSSFHKVASPTERSVAALNGFRKINTDSIGRWKSELPRLKAQIERYGSIDDILADLGYAGNPGWSDCLDTVVADNGRGHFERKKSRRFKTGKRRLQRLLAGWCRQLGFPVRMKIIVTPTASHEG